jgi:hypothetical protein
VGSFTGQLLTQIERWRTRPMANDHPTRSKPVTQAASRDPLDRLAEIAWRAWSVESENWTWDECPPDWRRRWRAVVQVVLADRPR